MTSKGGVTPDMEERRSPGLLDVLPIVAAHYIDEGNAAIGLCLSTWNDKYHWMAIKDMLHTRMLVDYEGGKYYEKIRRLEIAIEKDNVDVIKRLLLLKANVNALDQSGQNSLFSAFCYGFRYSFQEELLNLFIESRVDINAININNNETALYYCCQYGNVEATRLLLKHGADSNLGESPLLCACKKLGEDLPEGVDMTTFWSRRLQVVRLLCDNSADVNVVDENGYTALMCASRNNQTAIAEVLIDRDVDIDALDIGINKGGALGMACFWCNVEMVRLLLQRGATVEVGAPLLPILCQNLPNHAEKEMDMSTFWTRRFVVIELLANHGANLNILQDDGWTALMWASRSNQTHIMKFLLDNYADIDAVNDDNECALYHACQWANVEATTLLLDRGASVENGVPPIIVACQDLHTNERANVDDLTFWACRCDIVKALLRANADVTVYDADGNRPLDIALSLEQANIVTVLCEAAGIPLPGEEKKEEEEPQEMSVAS